MKIKTRLMLVVIPVSLITFLSAIVITSLLYTTLLKDQKRENTQLLTSNYASRLNGEIDQYMNIAQDLGSAVITSINVETTLRLFRRKYPQFSKVFYTPNHGTVADLSPYSSQWLNYDFSTYPGWIEAKQSQRAVLSQAGLYFNEPSVLIFAPCLMSYNLQTATTVEGFVILQLPLEKLFLPSSNLIVGEQENLFVLNDQQQFLYNPQGEGILQEELTALSPETFWDDIYTALENRLRGFTIYQQGNQQQYLSFTPLKYNHWSMAIGGNYNTITQEIKRITLITMVVILLGLMAGGGLLYLVIRRAIYPVEILTDAVRTISRGDKAEIPLIGSDSEIGTLSRWMNSMVTQLRNHQQNLERVIEEKTMELKRTNEDLEDTVDELNHANESLIHHREILEIRVEERTGELNKAHRYIRNVIDSIPLVLLSLDSEGKILQMNWEAQQRFNTTEKKATEYSYLHFLPYLKGMSDEIKTCLDRGETWRRNPVNWEEAGNIITEDIALFPQIKEEHSGGVLLIRDISKETDLEESLRQSQKMEGIGQLAGGVAHDFNNMLAGILGGAELMKKSLIPNSEQEEYLSMIISSADHASVLTRKLLSFSRKTPKNPIPVNVNRSIEDVMEILGRSLDKSIAINSSLSNEDLYIIADTTELHNIFLNMGINSGHAMPQGGEISFSTDLVDLSKDYCRESSFQLQPGEYVRITLSDTGVGIKPELHKRIFEPFFTTKKQGEGTGLGLAAVYQGVEQYQGEILLESEESIGTQFTLHFPRIPSPETKKRQEGSLNYTGKGCILLVDDEPVILQSTSAMLSDMGFEVITGENGLQGLELFLEHREKITGIILDMIMPVMNGRDCFFAIREIAPQVPVIIATGFASEEDIHDIRAKGIEGLLTKPYRTADLQKLLQQLESGD